MPTQTQVESNQLMHEALRNLSFLRTSTEDEIKYLAINSNLIKSSRYEIIYHRGDPSLSLYVVLSGIVKVSAHSVMAKEVIRSIVHANMIFGEGSVTGEIERSAMAQAMDKRSEIVEINARAFKKVMLQNGAVALDFANIVGNKLRANQSRLESIIVEDARTRVINFLKENAQSYGNKVGFNELLLKHSFTQQDIADFTGTSRQTVTTVLNDLKRSNIISLKRRRILIRDFALLT